MEGITSWVFIRGSKNKHPELWQHAGEPTLMGSGDLISAWPLTKYLLSKQYMELDNMEAKMFADKLRLPFVLSYFLAVISVTVFFIAWFVFGTPA